MYLPSLGGINFSGFVAEVGQLITLHLHRNAGDVIRDWVSVKVGRLLNVWLAPHHLNSVSQYAYILSMSSSFSPEEERSCIVRRGGEIWAIVFVFPSPPWNV